MSVHGRVIVYAYSAPHPYDPQDQQVSSRSEVLTWRREGQVAPRNLFRPIFDFDVQDALAGHDVAFVERLIGYEDGVISRDDARQIANKFYSDIKASVDQHEDSWGFYLSLRFPELATSN